VRVILLALVVLALVACQTPGSQSPGTKGGTAAATGAFGAQTVGRDQGAGQTPQTSTTGTATQNWFFASQGDTTFLKEVLEYAKTMGVSADQLTALFSALNGAPENVTITTGPQTIQSGSGDQTGASAGTGGATDSGKVIKEPSNN